MGITAKCSNGHVIRVKDEYAGKTGLCPHCRGRVFVPMPVRANDKSRISDDEILGLLGHPVAGPSVAAEAAASDYVFDAPSNGGSKDETAIGLTNSSIVRKVKICTKCEHITSVAFTHCPRCGSPLPQAAKPRS